MTDLRERRLHQRCDCRMRVVFEDEFGEGLFYVYSKDVSEGGLSLESSVPAAVGSLLFPSFELPGTFRPIRATGTIVRQAGTTSGLGVRFVGLEDVSFKRLQTFLNRQ